MCGRENIHKKVSKIAKSRKSPHFIRTNDVDLERVGGATVDVFASFAVGSANAHINAQVEDRLAAADIADGLNVFTTKDFTGGNIGREEETV